MINFIDQLNNPHFHTSFFKLKLVVPVFLNPEAWMRLDSKSNDTFEISGPKNLYFDVSFGTLPFENFKVDTAFKPLRGKGEISSVKKFN